jgi:DNA-binding MarR family transcriptional regulator
MSIATMSAMLRVLERVRKEAPEIPSQQLHVFLQIAADEGANQVVIQERCGMTRTSSGRNIQALTDRNAEGKPGLGWIEQKQCPENFRAKRLYLTDTGRCILTYILDPLEQLADGNL